MNEVLAFGQWELLYRDLQSKGALFIRANELPKIEKGDLAPIEVVDVPSGIGIRLEPDLIVMNDVRTSNDLSHISMAFRTPLHGRSELLKGNVKKRPFMTIKEGLVVVGEATYPYVACDASVQARAAATMAVTIAMGTSMKGERPVYAVEESKCSACLTCVRSCPYGAPSIGGKGKASIDDLQCLGCGICAASCPSVAISLNKVQGQGGPVR